MSMLLSGCINQTEPNFYINLQEEHIQLLNVEEIYIEILTRVQPDNDELFMANYSLHCQLASDGYIEHLSSNIFAKKGEYVYQYFVVYERPQLNENARIKIQSPTKYKLEESIFDIPSSTTMLNMQLVVNGINCLPWEPLFVEYRAGNPVNYGLGVSASYLGYFPTLPDTTRYFLLTDNGHEEIVEPPDSGLHYRFDVMPGYSIGYRSTSSNHHLVFYMPLSDTTLWNPMI